VGILQHLVRQEHHGKSCSSIPFIVPPTWNKTQYHEGIAPVWTRAAAELSDARNIFVLGYSMRGSDLFFRHLFALGATGGPLTERFWVFNPDESVFGRFNDLAGNKVKQRFKGFPATFRSGVAYIAKTLGFPAEFDVSFK
jgi:hypothetical protein